MKLFPRTPIQRTNRSSYRIVTDNYHGLDEMEIKKIMNNTNQFNIWKLLPFILLIIFAILTIVIITNGG